MIDNAVKSLRTIYVVFVRWLFPAIGLFVVVRSDTTTCRREWFVTEDGHRKRQITNGLTLLSSNWISS